MIANELTARALDLCRRMGRPFPVELRAYASDWQRQGYDLPWSWGMVKSALIERRALWQVDVEVRRHHDRVQRAQAAKDRAAGKPSVATPASDADRRWDSEGHQQAVPPPVAGSGSPEDLDRLSAERHPAPRQPYRRSTGTLASRVRQFLTAHVVRRGPVSVLRLERMAKNEGLLEEDQTISRSSTFRRVMKELGLESHRIGFGRGAGYVWRLKPPAWTRGLDVHG